MAFTTVTVTGSPLTFPGGQADVGALISWEPDEKFSNAGAPAAGGQAYVTAGGAYTFTISATDDVGTSPLGGRYNFTVQDPATGEMITSFRAPVPSAVTPTTLSALMALGG